MGFFGNAANKIRAWIRQDKEQVAAQFAKGMTAGGMPTYGQDLMQAYGYDVTSDFLRIEHDLLSRFIDYEEMDDYPTLTTAADIYADDATQPDTHLKRTIWVTSKDKTIEEICDDLLHRKLRMDEEIPEIARTLVKYGNAYEEILATEQGVQGLNFLPSPTVRRIEGPRGELYGFVQDFKARFNYSAAEFQTILAQRFASQSNTRPNILSGSERLNALEDWEVVHFRLRGKHRRSVYGSSVLEPARWIWKRLVLLEDAAIMYRLQRAPERYAFYVDVGDLPPQEALAYLNRVKQQHRKKKYIDPVTGKLNMKFDPISSDEDFIVPVRHGAEGTRIEVLGAPSWQSMEDISYFKDQMLAAIKIPKVYLAQSDGVNRSTLSSEDVRFARTILRVQRELRNGMSKVLRVHLAALNIDPSAVEFDVQMTVPSSIFELAQLEVRNAQADFAARMQQFVSLHWILSNVFGMGDEEIQRIMDEKSEDIQREAQFQSISQSMIQRDVTQASMQGQAAGQIDATSMMAQAGIPDPNAPPAPAPAAKKESVIGGPLIRVAGPRHVEYYGKERRLFEGSHRESEKRMELKLDLLLKKDREFSGHIQELKGLLQDVSRSSRRR